MEYLSMVRHMAIIMDGNRRWAKQRGLMAWTGHRQGAQAIRQVVEFCLKTGIRYVSLYAFSLENFKKRSPEENSFLFDIIIDQAQSATSELNQQGVRVTFGGDISQFPAHVVPHIAHVEQSTAGGDTLFLQLLFCYGAQQEIIAGIKQVAADIQAGALKLDQLTPEGFKKYLWSGSFPDPDIIIRTGGVVRLSNFLLYQAAYSELYFTDCLWPDLTQEHLQQAVDAFVRSQRNFGA